MSLRTEIPDLPQREIGVGRWQLRVKTGPDSAGGETSACWTRADAKSMQADAGAVVLAT